MLAYWPFAAGVAVFLGIVFVVTRLIRRKREGDGADLLEREEKSGSVEDSGPRWWQEVDVDWSAIFALVLPIAAILIALFSGPSEKEIALVQKNVNQVKNQLSYKAADSTVQQMNSDIGKLRSDLGKVKEDGEANTASLGVLAGRMDASDQKIDGLQKSIARARSDATVAREAAASASKLAVKTSGEVQTLAARQDSISDYFERKNQAIADSITAANKKIADLEFWNQQFQASEKKYGRK